MADYNTSLPVAGECKAIMLQSSAADDFYVGMTLAIAAATGKMAYSAAGGATPVLNAIAMENKTVAADGWVLCAVTGTEWDKTGLVDDSGDAITPTLIDKGVFLASGIIIR